MVEASYDLEEKSVEKRTLSATKAFNNLCEELEKGLSEGVEDFNVFKWKEFELPSAGRIMKKFKPPLRRSLAMPLITQRNLPVIASADGLDIVKGKL